MADGTPRPLKPSELGLLAGLALVALVTRVFGLSEWHFVADEYFSVRDPVSRALSFANPANYALIALSFKLFGVAEWSARLPSLIFGTLSIPVLALTWRRVFDRNTALLAAVLALLSSWHLWYSQFSRFYAALFLLGSLAYYLFYRAIRSGRPAMLIAALAANLVGILFHVSFVFVPISCAAFSVVVLASKRQAGYSRRIAWAYVLSHVLAALAAVPFLFFLFDKTLQKAGGWGYGPAAFLLQTAKYEQIPVALTAVLGLVDLWRRDRFKGTFFALATGVPLLSLVALSGFISVRPDYLYYTFPLILLLSASLCVRAARAVDSGPVAWSLAFLVLVSMAPEFVSHYTARKSLDFRSAVEYIEQRYQYEDRVISFPKGFEMYSTLGLETEAYPGGSYRTDIDWHEKLRPYSLPDGRVWLLIEVNRNPLPDQLQEWLGEHTSLVWRRHEERYDYSVRGYEIYLKRAGPVSSDSPYPAGTNMNHVSGH